MEKIREAREEKETGEEVEIENPEVQEELESLWDRPKPKKGTYPTLGSYGPGELNIEGDWEGPIELSEFEYIEEGWVNCSTGYYWHTVLGGGICLYDDKRYRNWEFDYKPPEKEVIQEEIPKIPQESTEIETPSQEKESLETPLQLPLQLKTIPQSQPPHPKK